MAFDASDRILLMLMNTMVSNGSAGNTIVRSANMLRHLRLVHRVSGIPLQRRFGATVAAQTCDAVASERHPRHLTAGPKSHFSGKRDHDAIMILAGKLWVSNA